MSAIPALGRKKQEDIKFKVNLNFLVRPFLKSIKTQLHMHTPTCMYENMTVESVLTIWVKEKF